MAEKRGCKARACDAALHHRIALTPRRIAHDTFDVAAELNNP
jgi:hypothetical protein